MSKKFKHVVWEGRFQPIHLGHLAYIEKLLSLGEKVWLIVVANEQSSCVLEKDELLVPEFSLEVDEHHVAEKNTLPHWLRFELVVNAVKEKFGSDAPVFISMGRRLDLCWDLYDKMLPPDRVFLTPERDSFEDLKAHAWKTLKQHVERIDVSDLPKLSATMVRDKIRESKDLSDCLLSTTIDLLKKYGYVENNECTFST